jgi:hypothetical protein
VEKLKVPTVPIITQTFNRSVKNAVYVKGMPLIRFAFVRHPVAYTPLADCRAAIMGKDPVTGKQVLDEVFAGLTSPLTAEEKKTGFIERPRDRFVKPDTADNLQNLFRDNGWTDYLPIILPTEQKVTEMLKGTSHRPDEPVGEMRPSSPHEAWSFDVQKVAINAVMAGAKPEFLPVILAIASSGVTSLFTSTNSFTSMVVVNGPIRKEINMNMEIGAFGPFNHANATIGRAWTLMSKNLGNGGVPGQNYMGSQGQGHSYTNLCLGEKEERLPPGWKPFHVQKGFKPEESVVSMFDGWNWSNVGGFESTKDRTIKRFFENNTQCCGATLVLDPLVADMLYRELGYKTKEQFQDWLNKSVGTIKEDYWGAIPGQGGAERSGGRRAKEYEQAKTGIEPFATWLKYPEGAVLPVSRNVQVNILVTGGETNPYWQGGSLRYIASASVDKWR